MSYARQAAGIPEICSMICNYLKDFSNLVQGDNLAGEHINHKALAHLSRASHSFFYSATPILWGGREIYTSDILVLLPGVSKSGSMLLTAECTITTKDIPDILPEGYFDRFNLYAPHVKHLVSNRTVYSDKSPRGLRALLLYNQDCPLLPNLISFVNKSPAGLDDTSTTTFLDWAKMFTPPSLVKLDMLFERKPSGAIVDKLYQVILASVYNCPNLQYLGYCYGGPPAVRHPRFLSSHTIVPTNLRYLRSHFAVFGPELLRWLEEMAQLNTLELIDLNGFFSAFSSGDYTSPPNSFPNLECLKLNSPYRLICTQLWRTDLVQRLTRLEMVFGDDRGWVEETIPGFFRLLVEKTPSLKELSLEYNEKHRLSTQSLQILQPLPLRKLSIPGGTRKRIGGPQAVRNLIQIWPLLEKLDLCSYEADFEDLRHIVPFCPQLSVLRLDIDTVISDSGLSWYQLHRTISRPMGVLVPFTLVSSHSQFSSWNGMSDMYVPEELDALSRYFANVRPFMNYQVCKDREDPWYPEEHKFLKDINSKIHQYSQLDQS